MFKFLRDEEPEESSTTNNPPTRKEPPPSVPDVVPDDPQPLLAAASATELNVAEQHYKFLTDLPHSEFLMRTNSKNEPTSQLAIKYIQLPSLLKSEHVDLPENVQKILRSSSDLVPGQYEGGFKLWECTMDLLKFLQDKLSQYQFCEETTVLDLGCGSGLLGLYALGSGSTVHFQDYNQEVINFLTIPNVLLNHGSSDETIAKCRFFSGDWKSIQENIMTKERITEFQYDYILTSETIYNLESLPKLYNLIKHCLKPTGIVFVAAKTCYFGVGGSTQGFLSLVKADDVMSSEVNPLLHEGVRREIIVLKFK